MLHMLALLWLFHSPLTRYTKMVDKVSASVIRITGQVEQGQFSCTGFVVAKNRVLTAGHCEGAEMNADGQAATILKVDHVNDLMLLSVPTAKEPLKFALPEVHRYANLTAIGYAYGWTVLSVLQERVFLLHSKTDDDSPVTLIVQGGYIGGMSGGPLVDSKGHVVGINQRANEIIGVSVNSLIMKAFLLGT